MSTDLDSTLELRLALARAFLAEPMPPGIKRANALIVVLKRNPDDAEAKRQARDLLAVMELRARLLDIRDRAQRAGAPNVALVAHGLVGHAEAELLGSMSYPGWRAAALDLLEPDEAQSEPLESEVALRLLVLALGGDGDDVACG